MNIEMKNSFSSGSSLLAHKEASTILSSGQSLYLRFKHQDADMACPGQMVSKLPLINLLMAVVDNLIRRPWMLVTRGFAPGEWCKYSQKR